jgi:hypothetical protein
VAVTWRLLGRRRTIEALVVWLATRFTGTGAAVTHVIDVLA